jgi:antitoxin MazE
MVVKIRKFGNSKGVLLPKKLMEMCQLEDEVHIDIKDGNIIISPSVKPRSDWEKKFKTAVAREKKANVMDNIEVSNDFDNTDWTW